MKKYDILIIGAGPGGYVAAIKAAGLGMKVALIEKEDIGGVCLNWGCIPTKALLKSAHMLASLKESDLYGFCIDTASIKIDYSVAHKRSRQASSKLVKGVSYLIRKHGIDLINKEAKVIAPGKVVLGSGEETIEGENIIIAAGARPAVIPGFIPDGKTVITSRGALEMTKLPQKAVIIGAGAVGMEFADIWNSYGVDVTIIEMMPRPLPNEDEEISAEIKKRFTAKGISILENKKVQRLDKNRVILSDGSVVDTDIVLLSAGLAADVKSVVDEKVSVEIQRGYIKIDEQMRTNIPGIYAIGDITGKLALAHAASAQGIQAVMHIAGRDTSDMVYENIPRCVYCSPQTASAGLTEKQAREKGYDVTTGRFPFSANGRAVSENEPEGFIKIVAEKKYNEILGVHMVGENVTELIGAAAAFISNEFTAEEVSRMIYPHPTRSEAIVEAALSLMGEPLHI